MATSIIDSKYLRNALQFSYYYVNNPSFRRRIDEKAAKGITDVYLGKPITFYVQVLTIHSDLYNQLFKLTQNSPDRYYKFFYHCLRNHNEYVRLADVALGKIDPVDSPNPPPFMFHTDLLNDSQLQVYFENDRLRREMEQKIRDASGKKKKKGEEEKVLPKIPPKELARIEKAAAALASVEVMKESDLRKPFQDFASLPPDWPATPEEKQQRPYVANVPNRKDSSYLTKPQSGPEFSSNEIRKEGDRERKKEESKGAPPEYSTNYSQTKKDTEFGKSSPNISSAKSFSQPSSKPSPMPNYPFPGTSIPYSPELNIPSSNVNSFSPVVSSQRQTIFYSSNTSTPTPKGKNNSNSLVSVKNGGKASKILYILFLLFFLGSLAVFTFGDLPSSIPPGTETPSNDNEGPLQNLTIEKRGLTQVKNGEDVLYTLIVTYKGTGSADILITDPLPQNTTFVSATDAGVLENGVVKWTIPGLFPNQSQTVQFIAKPTADDVWLQNIAEAQIISVNQPNQPPSNTTPNRGGAFPPTTDNCGGKYSLKNPLGNFGDPLCNFTKEQLYDLLKSLDPKEADYWFNIVVACESGYNPNSFADYTPDPAGGWGLYQMGRGNGWAATDKGDVEWVLQTNNAINHSIRLKSLGINPWTYWECAQARW